MRRFYLIGFLILLCFDTFTQVGFKIGAIHTAPPGFDWAWVQRLLIEKWIYFAILGYLGVFVTYLTLLRHAPVGPVHAASHLEVVTTSVASVLLLGEKLTYIQILGGALIVAGVLVLAIGSPTKREGISSA
ncbi:MAG: EamA family transporter [Candidatus Melainabacteria bacterium]|nr:MAG: EamA family transporter [Candidatus Melainabacteria bacterium]